MPPSPDSPGILQVLPSLVTGGVERGTVEITEAIVREGWRALVASAGGPLVGVIERIGSRHVALPLRTKTPWGIWRNVASVADLIRAERISVVHARSRAPAWSALRACRLTGTHFITTYHGAYGEDLPFKRPYNSVMARGEIVIAASRYIANLVMQRHGVPPEHVRVIPRGVDPTVFAPESVSPDRIARLATAWRLPPGAPAVMLPGRLTAWKGQTVLLKAVGRMARRDVVAVLVGSDQGRAAYSAHLRQVAAQAGIGERLRLVGHCDDMPAALALADVVVHASTEPEAFGRVVIEAQAMARPVIASDLGGPVETVAHGKTGWRVAPGEPAALAAALDQVLAMDPADRQAVGLRARAAVPTLRAMQEATLSVYRAVLGMQGTSVPPSSRSWR